jgi:HEXXH motif-containing protein
MRALIDEVSKSPELAAPLPSPEDAWDLLAGIEQTAPRVLDLVLAHPYTGSWAGYTTRLLAQQISGVWPFWVHVGYVHALAAAAAIRAGISFRIPVPVQRGCAILPTLGLVRLRSDEPWSVAEISGGPGNIQVTSGAGTIRLPADLTVDSDNWWSIRRLSARANGRTFSVRLDDIDPYRGSYEPLDSERLPTAEANAWRELTTGAWTLLVHGLPDFAEALRVGFESVAPLPLTPFRPPSASSSDAFGSAVIGRPLDAPTLAAMLIHEFQHSRLSGLTHLTELWKADPRERFYAPWRDDPRPIGGFLQGLYAFFGVTAFWRARDDRRSAFEFAYHRQVTWQALNAVRHDTALTDNGQRFVARIAEVLGPWQNEPVANDIAEAARIAVVDHYLGWRIRHIRPVPATVETLADAWLSGQAPPIVELRGEQAPTPIPDGTWSHSRADLLRLAMTDNASWPAVPDATPADLALVTGRFMDATRGYRAELAEDPDRPASLAGLAIALSARSTSPAARILMHCPELVRAVHRRVRTERPTTPEDLAGWIGRR